MTVNSETNKENQKNNPSILIHMNRIITPNKNVTVSDVVKKQHSA